MSLPRKKKAASAEEGSLYSYCEPSYATGATWHLRKRAPGEPLKTGGGIPGDALCGLDLHHGWDIDRPVTATDVEDLRIVTYPICGTCADAFKAQNEAASEADRG